MTPSNQSAAIIMAAGKGTRMKDPTKAKVMYEILGKPMVHYVVELALQLKMNRIVVVVGYQKDVVTKYLTLSHPSVECVVQEQQLGTGHAVMKATTVLHDFSGYVVVLSGDVPLLTKKSVEALITYHLESGAKATILTADMTDATGYGRIVRNQDGTVGKIVEHRDATPEEIKIREINSGIYVFEKENLFEGLEHIDPNNVQQEYYLTDIFGYFAKCGWKVSGLKATSIDEIRGINTFEQLEEARTLMEIRMGR